jgi:FGGY family of carbohydrate kinases, N-terminal domain
LRCVSQQRPIGREFSIRAGLRWPTGIRSNEAKNQGDRAVGRYVIGVDGGTESIRVGIFDLDGHPRAFAAARYETRFPAPGWAEQDPRDWWRALGEAVRNALAESRVAPSDIGALAVDTTCCSVVLLDKNGDPACTDLDGCPRGRGGAPAGRDQGSRPDR